MFPPSPRLNDQAHLLWQGARARILCAVGRAAACLGSGQVSCSVDRERGLSKCLYPRMPVETSPWACFTQWPSCKACAHRAKGSGKGSPGLTPLLLFAVLWNADLANPVGTFPPRRVRCAQDKGTTTLSAH